MTILSLSFKCVLPPWSQLGAIDNSHLNAQLGLDAIAVLPLEEKRISLMKNHLINAIQYKLIECQHSLIRKEEPILYSNSTLALQMRSFTWSNNSWLCLKLASKFLSLRTISLNLCMILLHPSQ